jgi:hypothetical protein
MLQVFHDWIISFLPSIQRSMTEEACCVVWIGFVWRIIEARVCQLWNTIELIDNNYRASRSENTSSGDGFLWGQVIGRAIFVFEVLFAVCNAILKLARREAKLSIPCIIATSKKPQFREFIR